MNLNKTIRVRGHLKKSQIKSLSETTIFCWLHCSSNFFDLMTSYFSQPKLEKFDIIAALEKITLYSDLLKWAELEQKSIKVVALVRN